MQGEFSQPFLKPPHLDQPISTLLLSESTIAFGRTLSSDSNGNYKAPLSIPVKKGYVLKNPLLCSTFRDLDQKSGLHINSDVYTMHEEIG